MAAESPDRPGGTVHLPAPTAAPLVTALGLTLLLAGLVTHVTVSGVGLVLFVAGATTWFRRAPQHLVDLANQRGGDDNVTVVAVMIANEIVD